VQIRLKKVKVTAQIEKPPREEIVELIQQDSVI
jgi:hypothetical protein